MSEKEEKKIKQEIAWKPGEYPTVYSNVMGIGNTTYDVGILFGELDNASANVLTATPKVKIILSPEQAKNLATLLDIILTSYIEGNGPLRQGGALDIEATKQKLDSVTVKFKP